MSFGTLVHRVIMNAGPNQEYLQYETSKVSGGVVVGDHPRKGPQQSHEQYLAYTDYASFSVI